MPASVTHSFPHKMRSAPACKTVILTDARGGPRLADISEHSFILPDGLACHYLSCGSGAPIVLLHGGGSRASNFAEVMTRLGERHAVHAPDLRGFGATQALPGAAITHELWAQDTISLLDHLGLDRVHLVGWSLGATVALNVAARRPERVAAIALLGAPHPDKSMNRAYFEERLRLFREAADPATVIDHFLPMITTMLAPGTLERRPQALAQIRAEQIAAAPCAAAVTRAFDGRPDFATVLPRVTCPVTLIVGEADRTCDLAGAQAMAARLAQATVKVLPDCGHYFAMEQPEATAAALAHAFAA